jgi:hypothetical protein
MLVRLLPRVVNAIATPKAPQIVTAPTPRRRRRHWRSEYLAPLALGRLVVGAIEQNTTAAGGALDRTGACEIAGVKYWNDVREGGVGRSQRCGQAVSIRRVCALFARSSRRQRIGTPPSATHSERERHPHTHDVQGARRRRRPAPLPSSIAGGISYARRSPACARLLSIDRSATRAERRTTAPSKRRNDAQMKQQQPAPMEARDGRQQQQQQHPGQPNQSSHALL